MNKVSFILLIFGAAVTFANISITCTAFICRHKMVHVFDWSSDMVRVVYTPEGVKRASLNQREFAWITKYASFAFTQFHFNLPQSGMNNQGLAIVGLMQKEAQYPGVSIRKSTLNELQFIQYALDNFATVDEVLDALLHNIQIIKTAVPMHYLLYDKSDNKAVVEFVHNKLLIIQKDNIKMITNTSYANDDASQNIEIGDDIEQILSSTKVAAKNVLTEMYQGVAFHTRWQVVFDPQNQKIDFAYVNRSYRAVYRFDDPRLALEGVLVSNPEEGQDIFRPANWSDTSAQGRAIIASLGQQIPVPEAIHRLARKVRQGKAKL